MVGADMSRDAVETGNASQIEINRGCSEINLPMGRGSWGA